MRTCRPTRSSMGSSAPGPARRSGGPPPPSVGKTLANGPYGDLLREVARPSAAPAAHRHPHRILDLGHDARLPFAEAEPKGRVPRLIGLGTISAIPAALAGLTDVSAIEDPAERRVPAAAHAVGNITATVMFGLSWRARHKDHHARGVMWSLLGSTVEPALVFSAATSRSAAGESVSPSRPRCVRPTHRLSQPSFAGRSRRACAGVGLEGSSASAAGSTRPSAPHITCHCRRARPSSASSTRCPTNRKTHADRDESTTQDQGHGVSLSLWVLRESVRLTTFGPQGRKSQVVTHDIHAEIDLHVRADFRRCGPDSRGRWASWAGRGATARARARISTSSSCARSWVMRATSSRSEPWRVGRHGRADDGVVAVVPAAK